MGLQKSVKPRRIGERESAYGRARRSFATSAGISPVREWAAGVKTWIGCCQRMRQSLGGSG